MSAANKRKGSAWERDVREFLREPGLDVEPLRQLGSLDEGDLVVRSPSDNCRFILEAKNRGQVTLAQFMREAQVEAGTYAANRSLSADRVFPVAVVKARQKGTGDGYAVLRLEDLRRLMQRL